MSCISPDGKPTESGTRILRAVQAGSGSPEEIARETGLPLFRVRSGLREMVDAGFVEQQNDSHGLSQKGADLLVELPG